MFALVARVQQVVKQARCYREGAKIVDVAGDYRDCLALISQARGDLEMMQPAPDPERILRYYTEACAYACDFNRSTLTKVLDHLMAVWTAHAEDGYVDEAIWFCESMSVLWREIEFAGDFPEVVTILANLAGSLKDQQHPNGVTDKLLIQDGQRRWSSPTRFTGA